MKRHHVFLTRYKQNVQLLNLLEVKLLLEFVFAKTKQN